MQLFEGSRQTFAKRSLVLIVLLAALCGFAQRGASLLKPGDKLRLIVVGMEDYSGEYVVLDDGSISGYGFSRLVVEGKTILEAERMVRQELSKILKSPAVSLVLLEQRQNFVYLAGAENDAGPIPYIPGLTLKQLVASIRLSPDVDEIEVRLSRRGTTVAKLPLERLLRISDEEDLALEAGDLVLLLPAPMMRVWFTGQVVRPGRLTIPEGASLYQGIAAAGGLALPRETVDGQRVLFDEMRIVVHRGAQRWELPSQPQPDQPPFQLEAGDMVSVETPGRMRVTIGGEVRTPGEYVLKQDSDIGVLLSMAQGMTTRGSLANVLILRGSEAFSIDYAKQLASGRLQGFTLQSGDFVYVQENTRYVYILGHVAEPGRYVVPDRQEFRASDLLALAKGLRNSGTLRRVSLVRPAEDGKYVAREFHLDEFLKDGKLESNPVLQPGDILLFGQPQGLTLGSIGQVTSAALLIQILFGL